MNSPARKTGGLLLLLTAILPSACRPVGESAATDVDPRRWAAPATVVLSNADTLTERDLTLFLRCDDRFTDDTLTLKIALRTPDSLLFEEYFRFTSSRGRFPAAVRREAAAAYRRRAVLGRSGIYRLTLTPCRPVRGVEAAGMHIANSN